MIATTVRRDPNEVNNSKAMTELIRLMREYKAQYGRTPSVLIVPDEMAAEGGPLHGIEHAGVFEKIIVSPAIEEPWYF